MSSNLNGVSLESLDKGLFPTLSSVATEVNEKGSFDSCPIFTKKIPIQNTRRASGAVEANCDEYGSALRTTSKSEQDRNKILTTAGKLFDVSQIIKYEKPSDVTESPGKYSTLARTSKNLGPETSFDSLSVEYDTFAKRVKEIDPQFLYDPRSQGQEKEASKSLKEDYPQ